MYVKPNVQSMILAEQVLTEPRSGRRLIVYVFNHLDAPSFPTLFDRPSQLFISLSGVRGKLPLSLHFVDLSNNDLILQSDRELVVSGADPLQVHEIVAEVPPLPLPHEGAYAIELHS